MAAVATVTGRTYVRTRARGFVTWTPNEESQALLTAVNQVLEEYRDQLPLTARQIFYRLVGTIGYEKTERAYARLCERLSRARRANLISFAAIRDDGTSSRMASGWWDEDSFWPSVRSWASFFKYHESIGQPYHTELWVEASGMVPQAAAVAHRYGIDVYSAGGFNGLTDKYQTAERLVGVGKPVIVLHVGDYDPSGCAIIDSLAEDVLAFVDGLDPDHAAIRFERVAVTPEQVERFGLPTAPQKLNDRRGEHMDDTVQAEALPPNTLATEIEAAILREYDLEAQQRLRERSAGARLRLLQRLEEAGL